MTLTNPALGDQRKTPYAVRVRKAFLSYEEAFKALFSGGVLSSSDIGQMWHHQLKSVEQAGEVLGRLRQLSDAHGLPEVPASAPALQRAIDCAAYIVRMFAREIEPPKALYAFTGDAPRDLGKLNPSVRKSRRSRIKLQLLSVVADDSNFSVVEARRGFSLDFKGDFHLRAGCALQFQDHGVQHRVE
jgi:hypothetical protein